jgi:hypothetical protein
MALRRTWLWILLGAVATGVVGLVALAASGVYFITQHVQSENTSSSQAIESFGAVTGQFGDMRPLYELDADHSPRTTRRLADMPTAATAASQLWVLAWDPGDERLVRLSLPFWILRIGNQKMKFAGGSQQWDLERLELDVGELERIGPALVFDYRDEEGVRVLLWTQ